MTDDEREEMVQDGAFSVADACAFSGLSRAALYREIQSGRLPIVKHGRRTMIPRRAMTRLLAERVHGGGGTHFAQGDPTVRGRKET